MKFKVLSELMVKDFYTDKTHIVISVRSPKSEPVKLPNQSSRLGAYFLKFHDIDERCLEITERKNCDVCKGTGYIPKWRHIENGRCFKCNKDGMDLRLFSREHAKLILDFVETYKDKIELIVVNCEEGRSRSPAIAGALAVILNGIGSDNYFFNRYLPNSLVYKIILLEYHEQEKS